MSRSSFALLLLIMIVYSTGCWKHKYNEHSENQIDIYKNLPDSSETVTEDNKKEIDYHWVHFNDTIGRLFILQFEYPELYVVEQIQNTISIGAPIKEPLNDQTNTMEWFIAIEDGEVYPVNYIIEQGKTFLQIGEVAFQDTIKLSGQNAVRLTIHGNEIIRQVIALEIQPVTVVIKDQGNIKGFERFFESIRFVEIQ